MKVRIKNAIYHFAVYMTTSALIFTLVFAAVYQVAYNEMYLPPQKMRLNGAKNLVNEIPVIEYAREAEPDIEYVQETAPEAEDVHETAPEVEYMHITPPQIENYHREDIQAQFVKKP